MRWLVLVLCLPGPVCADSLVATRTIPAKATVVEADFALVQADIPGALTDADAAVGQEAKVTIYPGRPIRAADLGPPTLVDRNQIVGLRYSVAGLAILTEGRALDRGGLGDVIRVMNSGSRATVSGRIGADGTVNVGPMKGME